MFQAFVEVFVFIFEDEVNVQFMITKLTYKFSPPSFEAISNNSIPNLFRQGPTPPEFSFFIFYKTDSEPVCDVKEFTLISKCLEVRLALQRRHLLTADRNSKSFTAFGSATIDNVLSAFGGHA
jgi:hypothetical protein